MNIIFAFSFPSPKRTWVLDFEREQRWQFKACCLSCCSVLGSSKRILSSSEKGFSEVYL